jgi:ubiquinone/menaquinone biosynthesis C-methylase UbiE
MSRHVCPWWLGYFIDNRWRRLIHDPRRIVGPYVRAGMTVLDVGCGMGVFSLAMAERVGAGGMVIAADLQPEMLRVLAQRARRAGVAERIQTHACTAERLGVTTPCDFALAFAMLHEVPDAARLLAEIHACVKPGGRLLIAEPRGHVNAAKFAAEVDTATRVGLIPRETPAVRWCRAVVVERGTG